MPGPDDGIYENGIFVVMRNHDQLASYFSEGTLPDRQENPAEFYLYKNETDRYRLARSDLEGLISEEAGIILKPDVEGSYSENGDKFFRLDFRDAETQEVLSREDVLARLETLDAAGTPDEGLRLLYDMSGSRTLYEVGRESHGIHRETGAPLDPYKLGSDASEGKFALNLTITARGDADRDIYMNRASRLLGAEGAEERYAYFDAVPDCGFDNYIVLSDDLSPVTYKDYSDEAEPQVEYPRSLMAFHEMWECNLRFAGLEFRDAHEQAIAKDAAFHGTPEGYIQDGQEGSQNIHIDIPGIREEIQRLEELRSDSITSPKGGM